MSPFRPETQYFSKSNIFLWFNDLYKENGLGAVSERV